VLILDSTSKKIRVTLSGAKTANDMQCVTSWRDVTTSAFTPGSSLSVTNGVTAADIVPAPGNNTQRVVDFMSIMNTDTATKTVTVSLYNGSTDYILLRVALGVDDRLEYAEGKGFNVYNPQGALKTIIGGSTVGPVSSGWSMTVLGADVTNNNASANTIADVTGLSFGVLSGQRYNFRFFINYTSAATSTGSRWSINGPALTLLAYASNYSLTTTTRTDNTGLGAYDLPAASNATSAATAANDCIIEGFIQPSADGTVIARFASEVSGSAIVAKRGSYVEYIAV
jgi:hypothetical protein